MKEKKKKTLLASIAVALGILIIWIIWGNRAIMVNEINIISDRIPEAFNGFRITQISDLHNAEFGENNKKLLKMLEETNPDIIIITGDLVDSRHTDIDIALAAATQVIEIAPTYYVTGNHEARISQYDELKSGLETAGVIVLEDEKILLEEAGEHISLLGIDDPSFAAAGDIFDLIPAMVGSKLELLMNEDDDYTVLLSHRPELFDTYVSSGVDLVFSGHAHGGQFRIPFIGGIVAPDQGLFPKYDAGLFTDGNTNMVVSRGIGNSILPFRINNRPEIVVVELKSR